MGLKSCQRPAAPMGAPSGRRSASADSKRPNTGAPPVTAPCARDSGNWLQNWCQWPVTRPRWPCPVGHTTLSVVPVGADARRFTKVLRRPGNRPGQAPPGLGRVQAPGWSADGRRSRLCVRSHQGAALETGGTVAVAQAQGVRDRQNERRRYHWWYHSGLQARSWIGCAC